MKHCLALALGLLFPVVICAQHADMQMKSSERPPTMMAGMGAHHHPVSTTNAEAQKKTHEAMLVKKQFEVAWKNADTKLTLDLL